MELRLFYLFSSISKFPAQNLCELHATVCYFHPELAPSSDPGTESPRPRSALFVALFDFYRLYVLSVLNSKNICLELSIQIIYFSFLFFSFLFFLFFSFPFLSFLSLSFLSFCFIWTCGIILKKLAQNNVANLIHANNEKKSHDRAYNFSKFLCIKHSFCYYFVVGRLKVSNN